MRFFLFIFLFIISIASFAQVEPIGSATPIDKFIKNPSVEWAVYNIDSIHFREKNLSEILTKRFSNGEIKATGPIIFIRQLIDKPIFYPKDEIDRQLFNPHGDMPMFDSLGNIIPVTPKQRNHIPENLFDSNSYNAVEAFQLFYIEHGILKSYIPIVSPKISIITSTGVFLGCSNYFSTCYNYSRNYKPHSGNKTIYLSRTQKMIVEDSVYYSYKLKELYNRSLIETLWPYVLKGKYKLADVQANKKVKIADIALSIAQNDSTKASYYDLMPVKYIIDAYSEAPILSLISSLEVVQDWYYDQTKNIVFNKVKELHVHMRPWKKEDVGKEPSPIFKIIF